MHPAPAVHRSQRVMIIGAGFAGTALALFLQRAGLSPIIYEARAAEELDTGAFLYLAPNGMNVLRTLGLANAIEADGFPTTGISFFNRAGKSIGMLDNMRDRALYGVRGHVLKRNHLFHLLRDEAAGRGIPVHYGRRLEGVQMDGQGVTAQFESGDRARGDLLIGADGINSRVRTLIFPDAPPPRYTGLIDTGGFCTLPELAVPSSPQHMVFGRRAFFGYMVRPDGEVYWFSNVPCKREPAPSELRAIPGEIWKARLLDLHRDDPAPVLDVIRATPDTHLGRWPTREMPPLRRWHHGRVCLIGDAAHATSPSAGQGASLALEDAVMLARCLRDQTDAALAFATFQVSRKARVDMIVRQARRNGDRKAPSPVKALFMNLMLPTFLKAAGSGIGQAHGYRVEWDTPMSG